MGRYRNTLVFAAALCVCGAHSASAQQGNGPQRQNSGRHGGVFARPGRGAPGFERWRQMPPSERQRFRSNAERWLQMPPEEQRLLRDRDAQRRERMQHEADNALRQSGLDLEAERREQYQQRYLQERRRIEQELRQEIEERRQRELAPVVERLKREFEQQKGSASPNNPAASPSSNLSK